MENQRDIANPRLTDEQIADLEPLSTRHSLADGEAVFKAGERRGGFFIVLEGAVEIIDQSGDEPRRLAYHQAREFTGDIDIMSRRLPVVSAFARGKTELLHIPSRDIRRIIGSQPGLGEVIARSGSERTPLKRFETEAEADDAFVLGVSTTLVERPGEAAPAVTAIFQDITEKKRLEGLRRRAERTEAIAELSASLAHEIRNPLASISSAVEQIASDSVDAEDTRVLRDLVLRESDRLSRLLTEFLDFARVKVTTPTPVEFLSLVGNVAELVRAHPDSEGRQVLLSRAVEADALWLLGAEDLLHRAVFNLVLNGTQWAGDGGKVLIVVDEARSNLLTPEVGELSLIRLTVADSGPGVPPERIDTIFDPFVTFRSGGTGLGLALVQRAVEAHGGAIFVDNTPSGSGAMFTLYLPAVQTEMMEKALSMTSEERVGW